MPMERSARLFNCARCGCQVWICSSCDRGNLYCGSNCSKAARRSSLCEAGKRYQDSRRGKLKHAARQTLYRKRQNFVTHHSSQIPFFDLSLLRTNETINANSLGRCNFCGRNCSSWLRIGFLRKNSRVATNIFRNWPQDP